MHQDICLSLILKRVNCCIKNKRNPSLIVVGFSIFEIGIVPNSRVFSLSKLASCKIHAHFPHRNWRRAKFTHIFRLEIGAVPISLSNLHKKTPHRCEVLQLYCPRHWIFILIQAFYITRR